MVGKLNWVHTSTTAERKAGISVAKICVLSLVVTWTKKEDGGRHYGKKQSKHGTGGRTMATEKRLIDGNDAIEKINSLCVDGNENWIGTENQSFVDHADVIGILSDAPTVDAVEVPPVKIGDTAFFIINGKIYEAKICLLQWQQNSYGATSEIRGSVCSYQSVSASFSEWGKTVFATREGAERVLYPCEYCFSGTYRSCEGCSYKEKATLK